MNAIRTLGRAQWLAIAACAAVLLLLGLDGGKDTEAIYTSEEIRMAELIRRIEGVKAATVMISYDEDARRSGAVVAAAGVEDVHTLLEIQRAVKTLTGLELEQIEVVHSDRGE